MEADYESTPEFHDAWKLKARDVLARTEWRRRKLNKRVGGLAAPPTIWSAAWHVVLACWAKSADPGSLEGEAEDTMAAQL